MLSISIADVPDPDTTVVMWPPPLVVSNTTISPAVTFSSQLVLALTGPL